jgi:hypothetical protein
MMMIIIMTTPQGGCTELATVTGDITGTQTPHNESEDHQVLKSFLSSIAMAKAVFNLKRALLTRKMDLK